MPDEDRGSLDQSHDIVHGEIVVEGNEGNTVEELRSNEILRRLDRGADGPEPGQFARGCGAGSDTMPRRRSSAAVASAVNQLPEAL
jgi:hypothetical protein